MDDDCRIERLSLHMGSHLGRYDRSGRQRCGIKAERLLLPRKSLVIHHHLESSPPMQHARPLLLSTTFKTNVTPECKALIGRSEPPYSEQPLS